MFPHQKRPSCTAVIEQSCINLIGSKIPECMRWTCKVASSVERCGPSLIFQTQASLPLCEATEQLWPKPWLPIQGIVHHVIFLRAVISAPRMPFQPEAPFLLKNNIVHLKMHKNALNNITPSPLHQQCPFLLPTRAVQLRLLLYVLVSAVAGGMEVRMTLVIFFFSDDTCYLLSERERGECDTCYHWKGGEEVRTLGF